MPDPFAGTLLSALKTAHSLYQFMLNDVSVQVSKIDQEAAEYFTGKGQYEQAETLLVRAYKGAAKEKLFKIIDHDRCYQMAVSIAICYGAVGQTPELTRAEVKYEDCVKEWKDNALKHLKALEDMYHSWVQGMLGHTGPGMGNSGLYASQGRDGLEWVAQERKDLPDLVTGVGRKRLASP